MARLSVDQRRSQLLALGLEHFSASPYDAVSIDDIAKAAGISKGLLYHYFPTKRDFYAAVLREASGRLLGEIQAVSTVDAPPPDRLRAGLDAYFGYVADHGPAYVALLRGGIGSDPEVARIVDEVRRWFVGRLLEGMGIGDPPPLLRAAVWGWIGFVEAVSLDLVEHHDLDRVQVREMLVGLLQQLMLTVGFTP
jgi:AcrR family transcriptional regulator